MRFCLSLSLFSVAFWFSNAFGPSLKTRLSMETITSSSNLFQASSLDVDISNIPNSTEEPSSSDKHGSLRKELLELPRHSNGVVDELLVETEQLIRSMHEHSKSFELKGRITTEKSEGSAHDAIFANTYVDMGKVDTVGFDYDYTLVTYTEELLELIYDKALKRLVKDRYYPMEMLEAGLKFDPFFSIRGELAVQCSGFLEVVVSAIDEIFSFLSQASPSTKKLAGSVIFLTPTK